MIGSFEKQIMVRFKYKARKAALTQERAAKELGVSLPTIKRWWGGAGISLGVLKKLCSLIGCNLSDLLREIETESSSYFYTLEQEELLAAHPKALAIFDLLVSGKQIGSIQRKYELDDSKLFSFLLKLDKVGLIALHEKFRIRLIRPGEPQWIVDGPLSKLYRGRMISSLLGSHLKAETTFFIHDYLPEDLANLQMKIKELEMEMLSCNARGRLYPATSSSFGSYICLKAFEWDIRNELKGI